MNAEVAATAAAADTRDLGFIRWTDMYGALEKEGPLLKAALKEEEKRLQNYIDVNVNKTRLKIWQQLFASEPKSYPAYYNYMWNQHTIYVSTYSRYMPNYTIKPPKGRPLNLEGALSFGTTGTRLWSVEDKSAGREQLTLTLYDADLKEVDMIKDVGDSVAARGEDIYYLGAEDTLWFNSLNVLTTAHPNQDKDKDKGKGKHKHQIYKEKEPKYTLSIVQPKHQSDIFLLRKSALFQDLAIITDGGKLQWVVRGHGRKIPITRNIIAYNTYLKIGRTRVRYPPHHYIIEGYRKGDAIFCTFSIAAKQALHRYNMTTKRWSVLLPPFVGEVAPVDGVDGFVIGYPNKPDIVIDEKKTLIYRGEGPHYNIESGEEPVPWFLVSPNKEKPKGLVIIGYGSYGMFVKKTQVRLWQPWLARGYLVATLCVRGGGEVGDDWWEAGRGPSNLHNRIDDFVAGTLYLQKRFGFDKSNTIIYGRSAGGFLVTAASYRLMDKIAAVYAAKPYTDLLRTTTNAKAGQTLQETDEFGYVEHDPIGFKYNFEISPYETAPIQPQINPGVLVTAGTLDSEVPYFQPVRYAKRLNDIGWKNAFCRIAHDEGHFTQQTAESSEATDAAILESFLDNEPRKKTSTTQFFDAAN